MTENPKPGRARPHTLPGWTVRSGTGERTATTPGRTSARSTADPCSTVTRSDLGEPGLGEDTAKSVAVPPGKARDGARRPVQRSGADAPTFGPHRVHGKRRSPGRQRWLSRVLKPHLPRMVGVGALAVAALGAANSSGDAASVAAGDRDLRAAIVPPSSLSGTSVSLSSRQLASRQRAISRDTRRPPLHVATRTSENDVEAEAQERSAALARLAKSAERYAAVIEANAWVLPLAYYRITATFGQSGSLWSSTHTGLDFAAPSGTQVLSVAVGTVTSAGYAGPYGNQVIVTLQDGTEVWYNHLTSYDVSVGDQVQPGQAVGTVGATGNVTGPHLHLEVRPGAGDPVDPYAALAARGLQP